MKREFKLIKSIGFAFALVFVACSKEKEQITIEEKYSVELPPQEEILSETESDKFIAEIQALAEQEESTPIEITGKNSHCNYSSKSGENYVDARIQNNSSFTMKITYYYIDNVGGDNGSSGSRSFWLGAGNCRPIGGIRIPNNGNKVWVKFERPYRSNGKWKYEYLAIRSRTIDCDNYSRNSNGCGIAYPLSFNLDWASDL